MEEEQEMHGHDHAVNVPTRGQMAVIQHTNLTTNSIIILLAVLHTTLQFLFLLVMYMCLCELLVLYLDLQTEQQTMLKHKLQFF